MPNIFLTVFGIFLWSSANMPVALGQQALSVEIGKESIVELPAIARSVDIKNSGFLVVEKGESKRRLIIRGLKAGETQMGVELVDGSILKYQVVIGNRIDKLQAELNQMPGLKSVAKDGRVYVTGGLENKANMVRYQELKLAYGALLVDDSEKNSASSNTIVNTINRVLRENDMANFEAHAYGRFIVLEGSAKDEPQAELAMRIARLIHPDIENRIEKEANGAPAVSIEVMFVEARKSDDLTIGVSTAQGTKVPESANASLASATIEPLKRSASIGGTNLNWQVGALTSFLNLIQTRSYTRVLSNPKLVSRSGTEARFHAGDTIFLTQKHIAEDEVVTEFVPVDLGIMLKITPKLDAIGQIDSQIEAEVSEFSEAKENAPPAINKSNVKTAVTIRDGQTIMLSGLVRKKNTKDVSRVPILADIPVVGELFKSRKSVDSETEMLVLVTMNRIRAFADDAKTSGFKLWEDAGHDIEFRLND